MDKLLTAVLVKNYEKSLEKIQWFGPQTDTLCFAKRYILKSVYIMIYQGTSQAEQGRFTKKHPIFRPFSKTELLPRHISELLFFQSLLSCPAIVLAAHLLSKRHEAASLLPLTDLLL